MARLTLGSTIATPLPAPGAIPEPPRQQAELSHPVPSRATAWQQRSAVLEAPDMPRTHQHPAAQFRRLVISTARLPNLEVKRAAMSPQRGCHPRSLPGPTDRICLSGTTHTPPPPRHRWTSSSHIYQARSTPAQPSLLMPCQSHNPSRTPPHAREDRFPSTIPILSSRVLTHLPFARTMWLALGTRSPFPLSHFCHLSLAARERLSNTLRAGPAGLGRLLPHEPDEGWGRGAVAPGCGGQIRQLVAPLD